MGIERRLGILEIPKIAIPKRSFLVWPIVHRLIRIVIGALFVFAGATKAYDPAAFASEIQRYQLVPWMFGALLAAYLPWLEITSGSFLMLGRFERGALLLITVLLLAFTIALASAIARGLSIDCGCFGKTFQSTGTAVPLVRNLVLLVGVGVLWTFPAKRKR